MPTALTTTYWQNEVTAPLDLLWPGANIIEFENPPELFLSQRFLLEVDPDTEEITGIDRIFPESPLTKTKFTRLLRMAYAKHLQTISGDITCPLGTPFKASYFNEFLTWMQQLTFDNSIIYRSYPCSANGLQHSGETVLLTNCANTALSLLPANVRAEANQLVNMFVWATRLVGLPGVASLGSVGVSGGNVTSSLGFPTFNDLFGFNESQVESSGFVSVAKTPYYDFACLSAGDLAIVNAHEPISVQGSAIGPFSLYPQQSAVGIVLPFDCA